MKKLYLSSLLLITVLFSKDLFGQTVPATFPTPLSASDRIFLPGRFLEIGLQDNADFGANGPPTGYHAYGAGGSLAEVYDLGHDGWTTGTPPFFGDYTLPGSPFEGWEVQVGTGRGQAFCGGGTTGTYTNTPASFKLRGHLTGYTNFGGQLSATWQGTATTDSSLAITQVTTVDTNGSAAVVTVYFKNTGASTLTGIYYLRSCDPDNDETRHTSSPIGFNTNNTIVYQNDYYHRVEVEAKGAIDHNPMALSAKDCRARCFIYSTWSVSSTLSLANVWSNTSDAALGTHTFTEGATQNGDVAIGIVFNVGDLAPGDSAFISYAYVFNGDTGIDSAFPEPQLTIPTAGIVADSVDSLIGCSYPGVYTFPVSIINGSDKEWTWGSWTWSPTTGLADSTGVDNVIDLSKLSGRTTYTITGYDTTHGMCEQKTFILTVVPCLTDTNNGPVCAGDSLILVAHGNPDSPFYWYNSANVLISTDSEVVFYPSTVAESGVYYVVQGNDTAHTVAVVNPLAPLALVNNGPICSGNTLTFSAATDSTGDTYHWNGPGGFGSFSNSNSIANVAESDSGVYTVYATAPDGCVDVGSMTIVVHQTPPLPVFTGDSTYCQYALLNFSVVGPNLLWYTTDTGGTGSPLVPSINTNIPGVYAYWVSETQDYCEGPRLPVTITVYAKPVPPTIVEPATYCYGAPFIPFNVTGSNILWYALDTGGVGSSTAPVVNTTMPGTYTYYASQTVNGCEGDRSPVSVLVYNPITANFTVTPKYGCTQDTLDFTNTSIGATLYVWNFGDGTSDTSFSPTHIYTSQGTYTIKLLVSDVVCEDSTQQIVPILHPLTASFIDTPGVGVVCQYSPLTFINTSIGTAPTSYVWSFGDGSATTTDVNTIHTFSTAGVYTVTLTETDFIGCISTTTGVINVDTTSSISLALSDSVLCNGGGVSFTANYSAIGDTGLIWNFGDSTGIVNVNPVFHAYADPGAYVVTVTALYRACRDTSVSENVYITAMPRVNLGADTSICPGGDPIVLTDFLNAGTAGASWLWSTGETTSSITVGEPGYYSTTVTIGGCSASDTVFVANDCYMDLPNVFTPNGDGVNDYFYPRQYLTKGITTFSMNIYNRWGQKLFETENIDGRGWDGRFNGKEQPEGVYVYIIEVSFKDGQKEHHQGNVTLMR